MRVVPDVDTYVYMIEYSYYSNPQKKLLRKGSSGTGKMTQPHWRKNKKAGRYNDLLFL